MSAAVRYPQRHAVTAEEFMRMDRAGVFGPEARLELIEGEIIEMAPIHSPHAGRVNILTRLLVQRAGDRAVVSVQGPVMLAETSVPQPDFALLRPRADSYTRSNPAVADVLLVVEVSDGTLAFDVRRKVPLYGRCGIPEAWVVDVNDAVVRVYRQPGDAGYAATHMAAAGERVAGVVLPEVWVDVSDLFPS